ncbi:hypothetical protein GCM10029992_30190 [Glycomyces albus]
MLDPELDRTLATSSPSGEGPAVVMVVGVNGSGKTTTCGKIARVLIADGSSVILGAADTFRAAAADQLETWGGRVGARVVRRDEGPTRRRWPSRRSRPGPSRARTWSWSTPPGGSRTRPA